jgi:quercetin dioxygenase-like cupin family protein
VAEPRVVPFDQIGKTGGGSVRFLGEQHGSSVSFYVVDGAEGSGPGPHTHPYDETFVVLEGGATFTVDGQDIEATAGTVIVVPAGAVHAFTIGPEGMRSANIHPRPRMEQTDLP